MGMTWLSVDLNTGRVLAELPDLTVSKVGQVIGGYTSTTGTMPAITAPPDWQRATLPWASAMVLLDNGVPIWGGIVTQRRRPGDATISVSLASWETYLDQRYVGTVSYLTTGQNQIVKNLIDTFILPDGIPASATILGGVGQARDRTYLDENDKTVLSTMQEISGVIGGPEWTTRTVALSSPERYVPEFLISDRIGKAAGAFAPPIFEFPGSVIAPSYAEDWSRSRAANYIIATSGASGDVRPQSPPSVYDDPERPRMEYRWSPSSSITSVSTLTAHADGALAAMRGGASSLSLMAAVEAAPRLGVDWGIGDDIAYQLTGVEYPGEVSGVARAIGWEMTLTDVPMISPILEERD